MLSARNAILVSLGLLAIAIIGGTLNLVGPPDSDGLAADSFGTYRDGHRATFELLTEFGVPVERRIAPPDASLPAHGTLVLWGPHDDLVENEPAYLERLLPWIEKGGRLIVAPPPHVETLALFRSSPLPNLKSPPTRSLWSVLGLPDVSITEGPVLIGESSLRPPRRNTGEPWDEYFREATGTRVPPTSIVDVVATGNWKRVADRVQRIRVPSSGCGQISLTGGKTPPSGRIECQHSNGSSWTLAANFPRGQGEIVVVAEPLVLGNRQLAQDDNAVLTYDLLGTGDGPVIFDEFYHGLSVRGNPLWLLTRRGAALLVTVFLLVIGIGIWRQALILGPPLESVPRSRRAILEYIDAMARFLTRGGRGVRPYLLTEARGGVLRLLGERLNLPPGHHNEEIIAAALTRRSPAESQGFRDALLQIDQAIQQGWSVSETHTILALRRLFRCL